MIRFIKIYNQVKEGDVILTQSHLGKNLREVKFENNGIKLGNHWFNWDFFFEVNDVIEILNKNK